MDRRILRVAETQHGAVTRRQLLGLGVPPDTVRELVRSGRLRRRSYGVYTVPGAPATVAQELVVAQLRCGPSAIVVGEPTMAMLGVRTAEADGPFVVLVRPGRRVTGVDWPVRVDPLPDVARSVMVDGVRTMDRHHQLLELAVHVPDGVLERLTDGVRWLRAGLARTTSLAEDLPHHPGARRLLASGLLGDDAPQSRPERRLVDLLGHLGPTPQAEVLPGHRVDVLLAPDVVLEYLGRGAHGGRRNVVRDGARRARIEAAGFHVEEVVAEDLEDPAAFIARIERLVARRSRPRRAGHGVGLR